MEAARALDCLRSVPLFQNSDDKLAWTPNTRRGEVGRGDHDSAPGDPPDGSLAWRARGVVPQGRPGDLRRASGEGSSSPKLIGLDAPYRRRTRRDGSGFAQDNRRLSEMLRTVPRLRGILATSSSAPNCTNPSPSRRELISLGTMLRLTHELNKPQPPGRSATGREPYEKSERAGTGRSTLSDERRHFGRSSQEVATSRERGLLTRSRRARWRTSSSSDGGPRVERGEDPPPSPGRLIRPGWRNSRERDRRGTGGVLACCGDDGR